MNVIKPIEEMRKLLKNKTILYDKRKSRFDYLVDQFEACQRKNPEQAEAYMVRIKFQEEKLQEDVVGLIKLRRGMQILLEKSYGSQTGNK